MILYSDIKCLHSLTNDFKFPSGEIPTVFKKKQVFKFLVFKSAQIAPSTFDAKYVTISVARRTETYADFSTILIFII